MGHQANRGLAQIGLEGFGDIDLLYGQTAKKSSDSRPSANQASQNYYDHVQHDHQYHYNTYQGSQSVSQKKQAVVMTSTEAAQYYGGFEFKEYSRKPKSRSFFSFKRFGLGF